MFTLRTQPLADRLGVSLHIDGPTGPASFETILTHLSDDHDFRTRFNDGLSAVPYLAFRWEVPGLTTADLGKPFRAAILPSPELDRPADPSAFADQLRDRTDAVVTFPNLGGDAILIVPVPLMNGDCYAHLAAFTRDAPAWQRDALWEAVGKAMARRLGPKPVWLNTAGAGVPWLHVRLDDRPKYYRSL